jgi:zona occludens toxin (predicted ATPase)
VLDAVNLHAINVSPLSQFGCLSVHTRPEALVVFSYWFEVIFHFDTGSKTIGRSGSHQYNVSGYGFKKLERGRTNCLVRGGMYNSYRL